MGMGMSSGPAIDPSALDVGGELAAILDALPDGLLITDLLGSIQFVNDRLEAMSGFRRGELAGEPVEVLVPARLRTTHERARDDFCAHPRSRPMGTGLDTRLRRKDGTEVEVEIQLQQAVVSGEPRVLAAVRDITERRRAEELLRERQEILTILQDRERIAKALHAGAIHSLFAIGLRLQHLAATMQDEGTRRDISRTISDLDDVIVELRNHALRLRDSD